MTPNDILLYLQIIDLLSFQHMKSHGQTLSRVWGSEHSALNQMSPSNTFPQSSGDSKKEDVKKALEPEEMEDTQDEAL